MQVVKLQKLELTQEWLEEKELVKHEVEEEKIQSNKSIIRDFNFNTTIPSNLTATIAIASQAPTSMSDLDAVTFANWTRGIKSRFSSPAELNTRDTSDLKEKYEKDLGRYTNNIFELYR